MSAKQKLRIGEMKDGVLRRSEHVYLAVAKVHGKKNYWNFGDDYEQASLWAAKVRQERKIEALKGHNPVLDSLTRKKSNLSLGAILDKYLASRKPFLKPGTVEFYLFVARKLESLRDREAETLSHDDITKFTASLKEQGLSNKTIKEVLSLCRSAYAFAREQEIIGKNIFEKIKNPKVERYEPKPFTEDEVQAILGQLQDRLRLLFFTQLSTGIRSGELIGLQFGDLDYERNRIHIKRTRRRGIENKPKTQSSQREVYLPPHIAKALKSLQEQRKATKNDYVFLTQYGLPFDDVPHVAWKDAVKRAGVDYRRCYTLRHTFASQALANNVRLSYVSEALGHTNVNVTASKYIRYLPGAHTEDEKKLSKLSAVYSKVHNRRSKSLKGKHIKKN